MSGTPNIHGGRENLEAIGFLQEVNATAYKRYPGIAMIAEESTSYPGVTAPTDQGGLGFGLKWNMGWMNDTLQYFGRDPMYREHHEGEITFTFVYAFSENFVLPISHDEVVHGKGTLVSRMPGDHWQKLANARAFLGFQWGHPGKQLLFMGQEFGQIPSGQRDVRSTGGFSTSRCTHSFRRMCRRSTRRIASTRPLVARQRRRRLPALVRPTASIRTSSPSRVPTGTAIPSRCSATSRVSGARL